METENKVFASTELLTKAFSIIYDDIFSKRNNLSEISKASEIIHPIIDAIEKVADFGFGKRTVYLVNRLKELCNTIPEADHNKTGIISILDDIIELTIISEKIFYINSEVIDHLLSVTDMEQ